MANITLILILSVATITIILSVSNSHAQLHTYNGNTYFFSNPLKNTWFQAYRYCNEKQMELLFLDSKDESDYITNLVRTTLEYSRGGSNYWIGATDWGSERDWFWFSTGKHVDYANWSPNEPSWGERCVHLWDAYNFLWNNIDCNFHAYFICKATPCTVE